MTSFLGGGVNMARLRHRLPGHGQGRRPRLVLRGIPLPHGASSVSGGLQSKLL